MRSGDVGRTVVVEVLGSPEVIVALVCVWVLLPAVLVDLEELAGTICGGGIVDLSEICEDRSPMGTTDTLIGAVTGVVLVHLDGDSVAGGESALARGSTWVHIALQCVAGVVLNGAVCDVCRGLESVDRRLRIVRCDS